ncbi:MAG: hypothetical protein ABF289_15830 [Clostridiales bacterium]
MNIIIILCMVFTFIICLVGTLAYQFLIAIPDTEHLFVCPINSPTKSNMEVVINKSYYQSSVDFTPLILHLIDDNFVNL